MVPPAAPRMARSSSGRSGRHTQLALPPPGLNKASPMQVYEILRAPGKELRPRGLQGTDVAGGAVASVGLPGWSSSPLQGSAGSQRQAHHIPAAKHTFWKLGTHLCWVSHSQRAGVAPLHSHPIPRQKRGVLTGCCGNQLKEVLPAQEPNAVFPPVGAPLPDSLA